MISKCLSYSYRIRKSRVLSPNDLALIKYRKDLRNSRRNILIEAIDHENHYEDLFLENRKREMLEKHRQNETDYRSQIIMNGFRLMKNIGVWKARDENKRLRLEGHIHKENLKTMNKDRIIKILNYQSQHFWFNPQNIEDRLVEEALVPEFAGSTEHYHHLTEEALAYERLDFDSLERIEQDQLSIKFKNKLLIPLYNEIVKQIKKVKSNAFQDNEKDYKTKVIRINNLFTMPELKSEKEKELSTVKAQYEQKRETLLKQMQSQTDREAFVKEKIIDIRNLIFYWKKYAAVLNMSSIDIQLLKQKSVIESRLSEMSIKMTQAGSKIKKGTETEKMFSSLSEQNTDEEEDIDMRQFLQQQPNMTPNDKIRVERQDIDRLDRLLDDSETLITEMKKDEAKEVGVNQDSFEMMKELELPPTDTQIPESERFKENSSVLIESWKRLSNDPELKRLLDEVGETHIEQSGLFWKVFSMH